MKQAILLITLSASLGLRFAGGLFDSAWAAELGLRKSEQSSGGAATPLPPAKIDPKAQELIDRTVQALGGLAFLGFKRLTTHGRIFAIAEGITAGFEPFDSQMEYPDKRRLSYGKKKPVVLINNGDRAWELDKMGVTHQLPEQLKRWKLSTRYSFENLLRLHIRDPGILVQGGGVDFVDNTAVRIVDIFEPGQAQAKLYINKETLLPVRVAYRVQDPATREWQDFADVYGDYQEVQGIATPMHITRFLDGERISEVFRNSARYDDTYASDTFEPRG